MTFPWKVKKFVTLHYSKFQISQFTGPGLRKQHQIRTHALAQDKQIAKQLNSRQISPELTIQLNSAYL